MNENMNLIKQVNLQHLRTAMLNVKTATSPDLARLTGLSVITVNALIKTLLQTGELKKDHMTQPSIGRPAAAYRLNENFCLSLIIYTVEKDGQDTVVLFVCDYCGNLVSKYEKQLQNIRIDSFDSEIQKLTDTYPAIKIIGLGLPVSEANGKIISSDYPELLGVDLCSHIENKFDIPSFIMTDIKAATAGYCYSHGIEKDQCVIGLYFPHKYPPGAAIYFNKELYLGRDGLAGRIVHLLGDTDWSRLSSSAVKTRHAIIKIVNILTGIYNPDTIVIYCEMDSGVLYRQIQASFSTDIEALMKPNIMISNDMNHDFKLGFIQLALNKLYQQQFPVSLPKGF
jgi:hypothetical protein